MYKNITKLVIGSANFGQEYGLANIAGKISETEIKNILSLAEKAGVEAIDTAQAYGDSESRLGTICTNNRFKMITKVNPDLKNGFIKNDLTKLVFKSCERLNQTRLYAVMLHRAEVLLGDHGNSIVAELRSLKEQGIVDKIGISIYSPEILEELPKKIQFDIVQAPFNIFDQRLLSSGWSFKLKTEGVEIHARSVFLQGLLLMRQSRLPSYFKENWPNLFGSWYDFLHANNADASAVALNFVLKQKWIDKVVVGVDSTKHLKALLRIEDSSYALNFPELGCYDTNLINPSKWKLG